MFPLIIGLAMRSKFRIGLFYNLRSEYPARDGQPIDINADWDIIDTFVEVQKALEMLGYPVIQVGEPSKLLKAKIRDSFDIAFNMCEMIGYRFREAIAPSIFELCSIPYTFSAPDAMVISLDKNLANLLVRQMGGSVPDWVLINTEHMYPEMFMSYPYIVKPSAEGSGMGINRNSVVNTYEELIMQAKDVEINYLQPALVQEFLPGREFTVGVLETELNSPIALEPLEILGLNSENGFTYNYSEKDTIDREHQLLPLPPGELFLRNEIQQLAVLAFRALGCRDAARIDIRLDKNANPSFLELNTLPHIHPLYGDFCRSASAYGFDYTYLLDTIIQNTIKRFQL